MVNLIHSYCSANIGDTFNLDEQQFSDAFTFNFGDLTQSG
jgi:hypothetical protein